MHEKHIREKTKPRDIILMFGAYNLHEKSGTQFHSPSDIIIHEDWNPFVESYDADIALLIMDDELLLSKYIKPVCLWTFTTEPDVNVGFIAGWGKTSSASHYETTPKQLKVPIIDPFDCLFDNPSFTRLASKRTFCGGSKNGSGPCTGK